MAVETKTFRRDHFDFKAAFFDKSVLVLAGLATASGLLCYWLKGLDAVFESLHADVETFLQLVPKMALAFLLAALVTSLVSRATIAKWLGEKSGVQGVALATAVGAVTPGGPMMSFPLVASLAKAGAGRASLIAYLTSWETLGFQRIMVWEIPLLGPELTAMRFISSIPLPFIAALLSERLPKTEAEKKAG
ncbi:MAG: permease [Beijerinckiaceae bacterium]